MAREIITKFPLFSHEQEENVKVEDIAGEDGVVTQVTTVIQDKFRISAELEVTQYIHDDYNRSFLDMKIKVNASGGSNGFTISGGSISNQLQAKDPHTGSKTYSGVNSFKTTTVSSYENTFSGEIAWKYGGNFTPTSYTNGDYNCVIYHNFDGTRKMKLYADAAITVDGIIGGIFDEDNHYYFSAELDWFDFDLTPTNRAVEILTATNFTDEENPSFTFAPLAINKAVYCYRENKASAGYQYINYDMYKYEKIEEIYVALSLDGVTDDITFKSIPIDSTSYTFSLTDSEREMLREKTVNAHNVPVYYLVKVARAQYQNSTLTGFIQQREFTTNAQRMLTIIGCTPQLNPTVKDVNSDTLALTGNENIFVRYESMVEFSTGAVASKYATIVSQSVQCGSKIVYDSYYGVIDDIESGSFIFNATDSRGLNADTVVVTNTGMIEYVKPTCAQKLSTELSGETGSVITLKVSGSYFNGSFGAVDNTLKLEVRIAQGNGEMGEWTTLTGTPTFKDNTYELVATFPDFSYSQAYTFQCRATDKLNTVQTSEYVLKLLPVFDWSEEDFNFNVPVNIDAEDLSMHGKTILRHTEDTNNTVLSASGGHIYIRPKGTDNTSGQTIMYPNGNIDFGGTVNFSNSFTIGGYILNDYVIETGSEAMGSNGTWYWQKWASGKAEAWGCRNFGNMAVTTTWGNLYRSAIFTQDLPDNVFKRTPDVININIVNATFGGWICKHEQTAPSAATTGSFIFVRPASATVTAPTYIGFHVIGEWY